MLTSAEPFGAECFDPELSAEGLMVEALSRSPAPGMNGREYKDAAVAASLTKKTAYGVVREYHIPWGVDRRATCFIPSGLLYWKNENFPDHGHSLRQGDQLPQCGRKRLREFIR